MAVAGHTRRGAERDVSNAFFERPILNSPYEYPAHHWELGADKQPTQRIIESRRRADFVMLIPAPKKRKGAETRPALLFNEKSTQEQQYDHTAIINAARAEVDKWRALPNPNDWRVTPETARLLEHWRVVLRHAQEVAHRAMDDVLRIGEKSQKRCSLCRTDLRSSHSNWSSPTG